MSTKFRRTVMVLLLGLSFSRPGWTADAQEERSLDELRNTVVNLLQTLVERGILTREQADTMVKSAQEKAAVAANATAEKRKAEEGAVRVPYVPEIVKDEIRKEVVAELGPSVKKEVVDEVASKGSLRSALPEWVQRMNWTGDVRVRAEGDQFDRNNAQNTYLDFNVVNSKGGIDQAGIAGLLNTTEDRNRLRLRLRFGFDADLASGWSAGMRLATGNGEIFPTTNQTFGTYGDKYQIAVDQGYVRWTGQSFNGRQIVTASGGRFVNPWMSTDLVWYNDLTFEGIGTNYRFNLASDNSHRHDVFATIGAFPLQDVTPSSQDKWLAGAQIGTDLNLENDARIRLGAAYYDYIHTVGQRNTPDSTLLNYTAPQLFQKGNTVFDISNSTNPTVKGNLYALAADYRIIDLLAIGDWPVFSRYIVSLTAEGLDNVGYNTAEVSSRVGSSVAARTHGYRADVGFGSLVANHAGSWHAAMGYRYLQRDAVVDAFNDEDFHLGGTDTRGYTITVDYWVNPHVWFRAKYLSADSIDGPPLSIDVWQLDVNTQF